MNEENKDSGNLNSSLEGPEAETGFRPRVIIAGGGTGGHIFPAIAIANAVVAAVPATEILFVGAKGKMEMEKVPLAGYRIEGLDIAGFNRSSLIKNIGLPFKLVKSLGGTISGEHGVGLIQKDFMDIVMSHTNLDLMRSIKKAFDPNNILNAGKIFNL